MDTCKTETRTATIFKDRNAVVHIILREGAKMDYYDALDHYLVIKSLSGCEPVLKLVDARARWSMQAKAQRFLSGKEVKEKTIARAFVENSSIKCVLTNFFYALTKPHVPTKVFTDHDRAYQWLLSMRAQDCD